MNVKQAVITGIFSLVLTTAAGSVWAEGPIQQREEKQEARIDAGINSGQVTPNEAANFAKGEAKLEAHREKANADGVVTAKEHRRLEKEANHQSRKIHRAKHNRKMNAGASASATAAPAQS